MVLIEKYVIFQRKHSGTWGHSSVIQMTQPCLVVRLQEYRQTQPYLFLIQPCLRDNFAECRLTQPCLLRMMHFYSNVEQN